MTHTSKQTAWSLKERSGDDGEPAFRAAFTGHSLGDFLLWVVDWGFAAVLLFAPWFMGGRHPLGELVLVALTVAIATAWVVRQTMAHEKTTWRIGAPELLLLAAVALVILQLTPLPNSVVQSLSPTIPRMLPLWMSDSQTIDSLGTWSQLSISPYATRGGLVMLLCYGTLFLVAIQRIAKIEDVERFLRLFAVAGVAMAMVGLLQYLTSNGKFMWVYAHPFRDTHANVMGPFINKNHFAHMLALCLGPQVWCVQRSLSRIRATRESDALSGESRADLEWLVMVQFLGLGLVLFAALMTLSRGGMLAVGAATIVSTGLLYRARQITGQMLAMCGGALVLAGMALLIHGYDRVSARVSDLASASVERLDNNGYRRELWKADFAASRDFAGFGAGIGSHRELYQSYLPHTWEVEMTHAENGYLQIAMESGVVGLTLLLVGIGLAGYWCLESLRSTDNHRAYCAAAAVAAGLAASLVHSVADFVWYIPACISATVILLACICRLAEFSRKASPRWAWIDWHISRPSLTIAAGCIVLAGGWMINNRFCAAMASPHWDKYVRFATAPENNDQLQVPSEPLLDEVRQAARWTPEDSRIRVTLAKLALQRFEEAQKHGVNPMALGQVRDAAIRSRFASRQELDAWLDRAVGEHRRYLDEALHNTRQALHFSPLLGEGYLFLADLCFLENAQPETKAAYVQQALKVRPYAPDILLVAGKEAAFSGDWQSAIAFWRKAFQSGSYGKRVVIRLMAEGNVPLEFLVEHFRPGWPEIHDVFLAYQSKLTPAQHQFVREQYAAAAQKAQDLPPKDLAYLYYQMSFVFANTPDESKALELLRKAIEIEPNSWDYRRQYGKELARQGFWRQAEEQFTWCLQRRPDDKNLQSQLANATRQRVESSNRSAAGLMETRR